MKCCVCHENEAHMRRKDYPNNKEKLCMRCWFMEFFEKYQIRCNQCGESLTADDVFYQHHKCRISDDWDVESVEKSELEHKEV